MRVVPDYSAINRANWDERVPAHVASRDYAVERFARDPSFLSGVVSFDRPRLGDVRGLRGVHLQCHIGTDTVSLARLGARMTGLDFSGPAVAAARKLAAAAGADADFVEADVYEAPVVLGSGEFDLVYTGVGALCWLPSVGRWAAVVASLLRPGGRLFIREGHPMLWALDDALSDELVVAYPYFEQVRPVVYDSELTYVETDVRFSATRAAVWNHGLGEIIGALFAEGMRITAFEEHDSVPWNALPGQMERGSDGEWRLAEQPSRLAASYTLQAEKAVRTGQAASSRTGRAARRPGPGSSPARESPSKGGSRLHGGESSGRRVVRASSRRTFAAVTKTFRSRHDRRESITFPHAELGGAHHSRVGERLPECWSGLMA